MVPVPAVARVSSPVSGVLGTASRLLVAFMAVRSGVCVHSGILRAWFDDSVRDAPTGPPHPGADIPPGGISLYTLGGYVCPVAPP
ncbi:hypothetical protein GCM10027440_38350 [Nocardiopsis coralliicola]